MFRLRDPTILRLRLDLPCDLRAPVKDGIEDHRHGQLDEEVNMSSTTRLAVRVTEPEYPEGPTLPRRKAPQPQPPQRRLQGRAPPGSQSMLNMDNSNGWSMDGRSVAGTAHAAHSYPPVAVLDPNFHVSTTQWERTLWRKLEVPADIIVLATSDPDGNCYLETKEFGRGDEFEGAACILFLGSFQRLRGVMCRSLRRTDGAKGEGVRAVLEIAAQPTHDLRRVAEGAEFVAAPSNDRRSGVSSPPVHVPTILSAYSLVVAAEKEAVQRYKQVQNQSKAVKNEASYSVLASRVVGFLFHALWN
ncbi:hypothetical protein B0H14DRAFT_3479329 [Mycena olivaceomarginata]|nr:hypothetical protein B0H14DRAFT_3479329 [Mycena olivaceomarginata]